MAKSPLKIDDTKAEDEVVPAKIVKQLAPQDILPEGAKWGRWGVMAQADHTIEDCLNPLYLFGKADQFQAGDYVEIKHPFGQFVVCLDIVRIDKQLRGIVAHIRHVFDYSKAETMIAPDLRGARVEFLGSREWSVVDGHHVVKDQFPDQISARAWLAQMRRGG